MEIDNDDDVYDGQVPLVFTGGYVDNNIWRDIGNEAKCW